MTNQPTPNWLSLADLPRFADLVEGMLQDTEEMYPLIAEAQETPWLLDDATVKRALRLFTERQEFLALDQAQLARWRKEKLSRRQQRIMDRLSQQIARNQELVTHILAVLAEVKQNTIEQILARDDAQLALDVLTGKLKLPR